MAGRYWIQHGSARMTIRLHVERLILDGVTLNGVERTRLERSLVGELTRTFAAPGTAQLLARHGALARLEAPDVRVQPQESGTALGVRIAHSVSDSLVPAESSLGPQRGSAT